MYGNTSIGYKKVTENCILSVYKIMSKYPVYLKFIYNSAEGKHTNYYSTESSEMYKLTEWVIVAWCQLSNFSAISLREKVNFQWIDDEVYFVLEQHT